MKDMAKLQTESIVQYCQSQEPHLPASWACMAATRHCSQATQGLTTLMGKGGMQGASRLGQVLNKLGRPDAAEAVLKAAQSEGRAAGGTLAGDAWTEVASVLKDAESHKRRSCPADQFLLLGLPRVGCTDEAVGQHLCILLDTVLPRAHQGLQPDLRAVLCSVAGLKDLLHSHRHAIVLHAEPLRLCRSTTRQPAGCPASICASQTLDNVTICAWQPQIECTNALARKLPWRLCL